MQNNFGLLSQEQARAGSPQELDFIINNLIGRIQTITLVQVIRVEATGVNPVGVVSVQPMVAQLDGQGRAYPHGVIHNIPYFRLQGGTNAVIIDPAEGDIGMCGFCSRDISSVKVNKAPSNPQSLRRFDYADGLYFGGFLNGVPTQYIHFKQGGIEIVSPDEITLRGSKITLDAPVETTSTLQAKSDITDNAGSGGKSMKNMRQVFDSHDHNGDSGGKTGKPNQKTA